MKLDDALKLREEARTQLLNQRATLSECKRRREELQRQITDTESMIRSCEQKFAEAVQQVHALLDADLAGTLPKSQSDGVMRELADAIGASR